MGTIRVFCTTFVLHVCFSTVLCSAVLVRLAQAADSVVVRYSQISDTSTPFGTIQEAYADPATQSSDTIKCAAGLLGESLLFASPLDLYLVGGFDINFGSNPGVTKVNSLKISQGSLRISQVAVVPPVCGNGALESGEQCDDGNSTATDGCSSVCAVESGYYCSGFPSSCYSQCGDGIVAANEGCDDNNTADSDGCSSTCTAELGYTCIGSPSVCFPTVPGVAGVSPGDTAVNVTVPTAITVTFDSPMINATLTVQTTAGPCSGSIQVSVDDFASCIALQPPVVSLNASGHSVGTLTPAPALSYGTNYKLRVTSGAQNLLGNSCTPYTMVSGFTASTPGTQCSASSVVISQIYGGGGNSGSTYRNDFIELHNNTAAAVNIGGWSVQYASATGSTWASGITIIPNGATIPAGGYYLVQEAAGAGGTTFLPTPDTAGSIAMAATAGKVALVNNSIALSGVCPTGASIVDFVGYGATNCFEQPGSGPAPSPSNTTAAIRNDLGCQDNNQNSTNFTAGTPIPRNSATGANVCSYTANECDTAIEANYCAVQFPLSLNLGAGTGSGSIYGRIYEAGITEPAGAAAGIVAELGYGPMGVNPQNQSGWQWFPASYNTQIGNEDEYVATFTAPESGIYRYTYRISLDGGSHWTYCDLNGAGSNVGLAFEVTQLPILTVN